MNKYSYEIQKGYCFVEKHHKMDVWQARDILLSKRQRVYTIAKRIGTEAELVSTHLKCPYCGKEYVANSHSKFYSRVRRLPTGDRVEKDKVIKWADTQISFFDDDACKTLIISEPMTKFSKFCCPKCKGVSEYNDSMRRVEVARDKKKVIVKSEIVNIVNAEIKMYKSGG